MMTMVKSIHDWMVHGVSVVFARIIDNTFSNDSGGIKIFLGTTTSWVIILNWKRLRSRPPIIVMKPTEKNKALLHRCPSIFNFNATPLYAFDYYGQLQTASQTLIRNIAKVFLSRITYKRELFTCKDGGTVALEWVDKHRGKALVFENHDPVVIIMHGLCGDATVEYLIHMIEELTTKVC
jgi:hypothetical protein